MEHAFVNELVNETSPYLLQHSHNPVQWHPWGELALQKARQLDKPILVSIGYAACHWCHVMERESFEDEAVATYMNEHFVNIKIDREERPDLDQIYMEAVQAITGSGGWPLNVFLTPEAKPFYGGTYFPPQKAFNRSSWKDVLVFMNDAWTNRRQEVEQQAETLMEHINTSNKFIVKKNLALQPDIDGYFKKEKCKIIRDNLMKAADTINGGFGTAPKFPQTFSIQFLLAYGYLFKDDSALQQAELSLQKMMNGGIYDHLAGGLARYSTDAFWLAPHFEKMLYDNALLVSVLCDAYQISGNSFYKLSIEKTLQFFIDEMQDPNGGFYSALDADSEGVEGKYYIWNKLEIKQLLSNDADIFCKFYGVTETGNWEKSNILHIGKSVKEFADENNMDEGELKQLITSAEKKLRKERAKRTRPATDDKILLGWNALLLTAFCKAFAALAKEEYKMHAVKLFNFLRQKFSENGEIKFHTYKNGKATQPAFLDDYAYFIQASIALQEITSGQHYLLYARELTTFVLSHFINRDNDFFYYTHDQQSDVITRKTDVYDNATPSGNSIMAWNLKQLAIIFDESSWAVQANQMLISMEEVIIKYPTSFAIWANLILNECYGLHEIVVTGKDTEALLAKVLACFIPGRVLQSCEQEADFPLLRNKVYKEHALIYLCKNYSCSAPISTIEELKGQLKFIGI